MDIDPILVPSEGRFSVYPVQYPRIWAMYQEHLDLFWTLKELEFDKDKKDWALLNDGEKHFVKYVLAFFAASDGIVNENLTTRFSNEVQIPEARQFYAVQILMEAIHSETYAELINTFVSDSKEKENLFNAIQTIPIVREKAQWAIKWIESSASFAERLLAFAAVEGIFFSSSFCAIYWLKDRGLMCQGLGKSNTFIARDEGIHTDFAILLHNHLQQENRLPEERAIQIFTEAVEIECRFASEAVPVSLIGMNAEHMQEYIRYCADRLMLQAGFSKIFNAKNPFVFMEKISMSSKPNFHEEKSAEYTIGANMTKEELEFAFHSDF